MNAKKLITLLVKIMVAALALYLAFRKVSWAEIQLILKKASWPWLLPALIFFNASQFISARRLLFYYHRLDRQITYRFNLRLYYTGMFYNLFLPGGIGGDMYKVIRLKQRGLRLRDATTATLLDRITGLLILLITAFMIAAFLPIKILAPFKLFIPFISVAAFLFYYFIVKRYFADYGTILPKAALLALVVQGLQTASFLCLLKFAEPAMSNIPAYAFLFLASSVIAAVPVSIGGIGTRELAMSTGAGYLQVSPGLAVTGSLLFLIMTALSALAGWLITGIKDRKEELSVSSTSDKSD